MKELCESPIEAKLLEALLSRIHGAISIKPQQRIKNYLCNYRVDFTSEGGGERIIIECDGRNFHDFYEDRMRDLNILKSGAAEWIVRFRGCDIHYETEECVELLLSLFPWLEDGETKIARDMMDVNSTMLRVRFGAVRAVARGVFPLVNLRGGSADYAVVKELALAAFDHKFVLQFIAQNWNHDKGYATRKEASREARRQKVEAW